MRTTAAILLVLATLSAFSAKASESPAPATLIPLVVRENIRAVYQISKDDWVGGVGKGLAYVKALLDTYDSQNISRDQIHVIVVVHGEAGYWLLQDEAYHHFVNVTDRNPNTAILRELLERGVEIDMCRQTMEKYGWLDEELLPGIRLVPGAYSRLIDLQLQGYAYIRF